MPEKIQLSDEGFNVSPNQILRHNRPSDATLLHSKDEWNKYIRDNSSMSEQELKLECLKIISEQFGRDPTTLYTTEQLLEEAAKLVDFLMAKPSASASAK